ncbi:MAG: hypothetical protein HPY85_15875 [Anaerolineae bacterium]|nr:hypothetical protein [Anaerolineae bacterium]
MSEIENQPPVPEDMGLCFYCGSAPAEAASAYPQRLVRSVNRSGENGGAAQTTEQVEIAVPRCPACARIHQRLRRVRRLSLILLFGVGIGGGLLMNLLLFGLQPTHPGGILFAILVGAGSLIYLVLGTRFANPSQIPPAEAALKRYPPLLQALKDGWYR